MSPAERTGNAGHGWKKFDGVGTAGPVISCSGGGPGGMAMELWKAFAQAPAAGSGRIGGTRGMLRSSMSEPRWAKTEDVCSSCLGAACMDEE